MEEWNTSQQCTLLVIKPDQAALARAQPAAGGKGLSPSLVLVRPRWQSSVQFWVPPHKTSIYLSEPRGPEGRRCKKGLRELFSPEERQVRAGVTAAYSYTETELDSETHSKRTGARGHGTEGNSNEI